MDKSLFFRTLTKTFSHRPTRSQEAALRLLADFLLDNESPAPVFLLKGYAGTGKTSITNCLVKCLPIIRFKSILLAPTGRASKVMSAFAQQQAYTIHKFIYYHQNDAQNGMNFVRKPNKYRNTLFIVDEASMIGDTPDGYNSLLDDLINYVYSGTDCKLLFLGDTAQLPPVNAYESPALNSSYLSLNYGKNTIETELTEVVRQKAQSGILANATHLREMLPNSCSDFLFDINNYTDIQQLTQGMDIQEALQDAYSYDGAEQTAVIVRSNKRAVLYNKQIRNVILGNDDELSTGDLLMVVKNNYYWLKDSTQVSFIANGDTLELLQIYTYKEWYGFRFAEVKVRLVDYPEQTPFDTILLLDTLESESPALPQEDAYRLYQEVMQDYIDETSNRNRHQKTKENPYFNALQVKYSYAITCHKSQGGQWKNIFIEKPYIPDGQDDNYLRWLYTALTRATQKVYLIGYKDEDFTENSLYED
ncbi:MAG: AAA family ATPase [Capnocytophaga sp.]|nr:AAA family ATPase [Capnocytophaga sp.]